MALTKSNVFFTSLLILVALFGVVLGETLHKVGDSNGWTVMGANYESWASSKTFQVGDSLVFEYNNADHDVNEVTLDKFELCEPSNPLARYETGSDTVTLTKPGVHNFICGFPGHCDIGQKLQIMVLPASLGPVAAPVPGPVQSPSSSLSPSPSPLAYSPVNHAPQYQVGPAPTSHSAASLGPVAAPVPGPVRSPSSSLSPSPSPLAYSLINHAPQYQMGPAPTPHSAASDSKSVWIGISFLSLLSLFILVLID